MRRINISKGAERKIRVEEISLLSLEEYIINENRILDILCCGKEIKQFWLSTITTYEEYYKYKDKNEKAHAEKHYEFYAYTVNPDYFYEIESHACSHNKAFVLLPVLKINTEKYELNNASQYILFGHKWRAVNNLLICEKNTDFNCTFGSFKRKDAHKADFNKSFAYECLCKWASDNNVMFREEIELEEIEKDGVRILKQKEWYK